MHYPDTFDIPDDKKPEICRQVLSYVENKCRFNNELRISKIDRNWATYLGLPNPQRENNIVNVYGQENRQNFINLRLSQNKINLLQGEFLESPLNSTVLVSSREIDAQRAKNQNIQLGLLYAGKEVEFLRNKVGINVLDGMPIPESREDAIIRTKKSLHQIWMQEMLNRFIENQDIKTKFADNFLSCEITAELHGVVENHLDGSTSYRCIDSRNALFEENINDPFCESSPYKGEKKYAFTNEILSDYYNDLKPEEREMIKSLEGGSYQNDRPFYFQLIDGKLAIEIIVVQIKFISPVRTRFSPNPKNPSRPFPKSISSKGFEINYETKEDGRIYNKKQGRYEEVITQWKEEIWEAHRIGGVIDTRIRPKYWQQRSVDEPSKTDFDYVNCLFNTHSGIRVSLQEICENIDFLYNVIWYQIFNEIGKFKGKVIVLDRALLPKGKVLKDLIMDMVNDGIVDINTAADSSRTGLSVKDHAGVTTVDLGVSESLVVLFRTAFFLEQNLDRFTGINEERQGEIKASATVTNTQSAIVSSRSITAPMFYMMGRFMERVLTKACEYMKMAYGLFAEDNPVFLEIPGIGITKIDKEIAKADYRLLIKDGRREQNIRQRITQIALADVNAGNLRTKDVVGMELSETLEEVKFVLEKAWNEVEQVNAKRHEERMEEIQANLQGQLSIAREKREDEQQHEKELTVLEHSLDSNKATQDSKNSYILEQARQAKKENLNKDLLFPQ